MYILNIKRVFNLCFPLPALVRLQQKTRRWMEICMGSGSSVCSLLKITNALYRIRRPPTSLWKAGTPFSPFIASQNTWRHEHLLLFSNIRGTKEISAVVKQPEHAAVQFLFFFFLLFRMITPNCTSEAQGLFFKEASKKLFCLMILLQKLPMLGRKKDTGELRFNS